MDSISIFVNDSKGVKNEAEEREREEEEEEMESRMDAASRSGWVDSSGYPIWPPNGGFKGSSHKEILKAGTMVDRYGENTGSFVAPVDVPYEQRSLFPSKDKPTHKKFMVLKDIEVDAGITAPWFGEPGGGTQYKFGEPISSLIAKGFLKEI